MLPLQIAVATRSLQEPLKQSIQTAGAMGAQAVHLDLRNEIKPAEFSDTGRRQFLHYLEELNLSVASAVFPTRRAFYDLDELDDRLNATREAMDFAFQFKAKVLTLRVGRVPDEADSAERQILTQVLNDLAAYGNRVGVTLAITPTRDAPEQLAQLIGEITSGPIGINFDPASFVMAGFDPSQALALESLRKFLVHVMVRDGLRDMDGSGVEVPVGRGEVDWEHFLALLEEAEYRDWLTIDRTQGQDRPGDIRRAIQYLHNVATG